MSRWWLLLLLVPVVLLVVLQPNATGPGWTDAGPGGHASLVESLSTDHQVRILESGVAALPPEAGRGDTVVLLPGQRPATGLEVQRGLQFLHGGGRLVLAADGVHANQWTEALGLQLRPMPALLPPQVLADCLGFRLLVDNRLVSGCLPSPAAFSELPADDGRLVAVGNASTPVFLDLDGDAILTDADLGPHPFPVAILWQHGAGTALLVADDDAWTNAILQDHPENLDLLDSDGGTIFLDSSGAPASIARGVQTKFLRVLATPGGIGAVALLLFLTAGLVTMLRTDRVSAWSHQPEDPGEDPDVEAAAARLRGL